MPLPVSHDLRNLESTPVTQRRHWRIDLCPNDRPSNRPYFAAGPSMRKVSEKEGEMRLNDARMPPVPPRQPYLSRLRHTPVDLDHCYSC